MARILITSGPTRQYLDPVRYLTNGSSGVMGSALAQAALQAGHQVVVVSGPVRVRYPAGVKLREVETTQEMLDACLTEFPDCDGLIGAAAPCDYQPATVSSSKLKKTGEPLLLKLVETPDIVATLGRQKRANQWTVGFALESEDARFQAIGKLQRKLCNLVVVNGVSAINSPHNEIEILDPNGQVVSAALGTKQKLAKLILRVISEKLLEPGVAMANNSGKATRRGK
jgi:phosphopantothenoylcysteine decarboxylase/phosphopantothenate--cysteine ligase